MTLPGGDLRRIRLERLQNDSGATLIEFAISLSLMLTFLFVLLETCIAIYTFCMVSETAKETTRWAITRGSTCQTSTSTSCTATKATIESHVSTIKYPNPAGGTLTPTATFPVQDAGCTTIALPGCRVLLSISYTMPITMPFVPKNSITWTTQSEMYILQ